MTAKQVLEMIAVAHNPTLRDRNGRHVYQVWENGQITSQKSGELYGLRNIHEIAPPLEMNVRFVLPVFWPKAVTASRNTCRSFAFADPKDAERIRVAMAECAGVTDAYNECVGKKVVEKYGAEITRSEEEKCEIDI